MNKIIKPTRQRSCIGCTRKTDQSELIRISSRDEKLLIDKSNNKQGRGIYLCPREECFQKAVKKNAFSHRLKTKISAETINSLHDEFVKHIISPTLN